MIQKGLRFSILILTLLLIGCVRGSHDNEGQLQSYSFSPIEAKWIREGSPLEYDGEKWYPVNDVEILMDSEVFQVGEYKNVQIFVDKMETKPYKRIYTKFGKNKFRYYEQRRTDD